MFKVVLFQVLTAGKSFVAFLDRGRRGLLSDREPSKGAQPARLHSWGARASYVSGMRVECEAAPSDADGA